MSTLATRLSDLATRIATECKAIRTMVNGNAAGLNALTTTAKDNLVNAINEVKALASTAASNSGAHINDAATTSTTDTYSIDKIHSELTATSAALKADILGGAGAAYDTLQELKALLDGEAADITSLTNAIGNRVRFDAAQALTAPQQAQARANIGADITSAQTGNTDTDLVAVFTTGLA